MSYTYCSIIQIQNRKLCVLALAFLAVFGFSFGIYIASYSVAVSSLVRVVSYYHASTVGRFLALLLPFAFSAAAVYLSNTLFLYPLIFIKCFLYSFHMFAIYNAFEYGGWLACLLYQLADTVALSMLILFSLHYLHGFSNKAQYVLFAFASVVFGIGAVDIVFISPFLTSLFK